MFKNYSRVRLLTNKFGAQGLKHGDIGYIIETYDNDAYEIEFSDNAGITVAQIVAQGNDIELPASAIQIARRSLVLAAVICRGSIESEAGNPEALHLYNRIHEWLTQLDLWNELESIEEIILHTPLGKLERNDVIRATWYVEGLAILSWALNQMEFPQHDQEVDSPEVAASVWFLSDDADEFLRKAELRNQLELGAGYELLYAIHTRLRDFIRHRESKDFINWIDDTWIDALKLNKAHLIVDNDLGLHDKAINQVTEDQILDCTHIIFQRHRAVNWLFGQYPSFSEMPIDT